MEAKAAASETAVRWSQSLCAGEQQYVRQRKQVQLKTLSSLGIICTAGLVPHITLLGSGGGQRAAVGLVGSLYQMEKEGLLDTLLYLGGVSGSTWSMSSLYSDPEWSTNLDRAVSRLSGPGVEMELALAWLDERSKEEHFSRTDVWGVLTSAGIMKQMDLRRFSDEASRNASNPYPIYCAIEKHCFSNGPIEGTHTLGLAVHTVTSLLGSRFQGGKLLEQKPEMDMVQLQGVCSQAEQSCSKVLGPFMFRNKKNKQTIFYLSVDDAWGQKLLCSLVVKQQILLYLLSDVSRVNKLQYRQLSLSDCVKCTNCKCEMPLNVNVILFEGLTLCCWAEHSVPPCLQLKDRFHLFDAGLLINVAYPSFLGDKRDIDLLIAPEYSAGNMFEVLDYAAAVNKPFPEIDEKILEERDWPKDCYVFEGKDKEPTIVYMPLFNRNNCKGLLQQKQKYSEHLTNIAITH
uniref:PLA2c domain-containing protein n=1 Tax=Sparus aurata TaxID=8175 RepID=A0A671US66_SPAAU